jgi:hypothetical protein
MIIPRQDECGQCFDLTSPNSNTKRLFSRSDPIASSLFALFDIKRRLHETIAKPGFVLSAIRHTITIKGVNNDLISYLVLAGAVLEERSLQVGGKSPQIVAASCFESFKAPQHGGLYR